MENIDIVITKKNRLITSIEEIGSVCDIATNNHADFVYLLFKNKSNQSVVLILNGDISRDDPRTSSNTILYKMYSSLASYYGEYERLADGHISFFFREEIYATVYTEPNHPDYIFFEKCVKDRISFLWKKINKEPQIRFSYVGLLG